MVHLATQMLMQRFDGLFRWHIKLEAHVNWSVWLHIRLLVLFLRQIHKAGIAQLLAIILLDQCLGTQSRLNVSIIEALL